MCESQGNRKEDADLGDLITSLGDYSLLHSVTICPLLRGRKMTSFFVSRRKDADCSPRVERKNGRGDI